MVVELIDFNQCCWLEDLVCHLFLHHNKAILQIPLNLAWSEDKLVWNFNKNRIFIFKSSYKVGMDYIHNSISSLSTSSMMFEIKLWDQFHSLPI